MRASATYAADVATEVLRQFLNTLLELTEKTPLRYVSASSSFPGLDLEAWEWADDYSGRFVLFEQAV